MDTPVPPADDARLEAPPGIEGVEETAPIDLYARADYLTSADGARTQHADPPELRRRPVAGRSR